ncbi:MAG TPA: zf-HC2 domain-containing protein, partial [Planctomycetota bacterium]|nr:zf-HC2 domain-containing protein [Planctomycetota bacterium]
MSDCERFRGRIEEFHDGELPEELRSDVERHVVACAGCAAEQERVRRLERLLAESEAPFRANVDFQVGRIRERIVERGPRFLKTRILGAAAAGLAAVGVVWLAMRTSEPIEDKVARLVREYLEARNGQSDRLATE